MDLLRGGTRAVGWRILGAVLGWVPVRLLKHVRSQFLVSPHGSRRRRVLRQVLEVVRHRGLPVGESTFALVDDPSIRFAREDSAVLQRVYWMGREGWEPELVRWWPVLCSEATGILELGANVGYYTVQGARAAPHAPYRAVEPHPRTAAVLRGNLELNGISTVEVVEAAATGDSAAGSVELLVPRFDHFDTPAGALVAERSEIRRPGTRAIQVVSVPVTTLMGGVDLLKLDVEGQEHELLQALVPHLVESRPTICVELLLGTPKLRGLLIHICELVGYTILIPGRSRLRELPLHRLRTTPESERLETRDVILTSAPTILGRLLPDRPGQA
jgi:FkbM family methyltransferase